MLLVEVLKGHHSRALYLPQDYFKPGSTAFRSGELDARSFPSTWSVVVVGETILVELPVVSLFSVRPLQLTGWILVVIMESHQMYDIYS